MFAYTTYYYFRSANIDLLGGGEGRLCFSMASCGQVLIKIYFVRLHNVYYYFLSASIGRLGGGEGRLCFSVASCGQILMEI